MSANVSKIGSRFSGFGQGTWFTILGLALVVFLANFAYDSHLQGQETSARALTADLQVLSQQLAKYAQEAVSGNQESFDEFKATKSDIDARVKALRVGGTVGKQTVPGYESGTVALLRPGVTGALKKVTT